MAESTTTTTTTKADTTTTTVAEKQGEVQVDKSADAHELREQSSDERLDDARAEGLRNAAADRENTGAATDLTPRTNDRDDA